MVSVGFDASMAGRYFPGVSSSDVFTFTVSPAFLSVVGSNDKLS